MTLCPDENIDNPFFREIVRCTPEVSKIIILKDPIVETTWIFSYAGLNKFNQDELYLEREERLNPLIKPLDEESSEEIFDLSEESDIDDSTTSSNKYSKNYYPYNYKSDHTILLCDCLFCTEFRSYLTNRQRNVRLLIHQVLSSIANNINYDYYR